MTRKKQSKRRLGVYCLMGCMVLMFSHPFSFVAQGAESAPIDKTASTAVSRTISGRVIDVSGEPIIGATVQLKESKNVVVTDMDGHFTIKCDVKDPILKVSYIGYDAVETKVKGSKPIRITMTENTKALDEVVVVGYGTMRRSDVTGAISSVKGSELVKNSTSNVVQSLAGKLSGVQVVQNSGTPGGDVSILIRGVGTINDASPLYVIDGVPVNGGMWYINPADVESIDVLKDASATAIYGSRASNGVVLITTRQGYNSSGQRGTHRDKSGLQFWNSANSQDVRYAQCITICCFT